MTPKRKYDRKIRNKEIRNQKPIVLIVAEGKNVTESQYFKSFQKQNSKCSIRMIIAKHVTDPEGMLKVIKQKWKSMGLDVRKGDRAYVVMDLDCDDNKAAIIKKLTTKTSGIQFIVSNPCFEVWFLIHFKYSTKAFLNSESAIRELKKHISNYDKTLNVSDGLLRLTDSAIKNSEKLRKHYDGLGYEWPSNQCNPRTDVDVVIKKIDDH